MEAAVVSGILKIVSNKLGPLLIKEYSLIVGVQKHLLELKDQVQEINYWLEAVGDKVSPDTPAFNWLRKLKDIAYDVDDIVDEFQLKAEEHDAHGAAGVVSRYMCEIPKSLILQCKAASKLKAVKKRFDAIVEQRTEFNAIANSLLVGHSARDMRQTTVSQTTLPTVDVASVLGRNQEKHHIISKLVDDRHTMKTISMIGLGGSGKTTLAKLVFSDSIVEKHFEVKLWVHVSQEFDVDKLIKKLFEAFADNNPGQHAQPYMVKTISDKLTGKRLLLVLDDVWTESLIQWENFMVHLKSSAPGSRILLTARSRRVAETVRSIDKLDLPFLSLNDSWQLFQQSLVIPTEGLESEFVKVGKEIVKKCGGVPLAIKALAGVLSGMEQIQEWESVRDSNVLDVEGEEHIVAACLRLSYLNLPSHLKQCFTICSLFPKGHSIDKEQLIDLWIAHDMITVVDSFDYLNLEYAGHKYFNSLLEVYFLQNVKEVDGRVTCGMHDLVHDLAFSILGDEISLVVPKEQKISTKSYRYLSLREQPEDIVPKNIFEKARAVYITKCYDYIFGMALKNAKHLRSVTVGSPYETALPNALFQIDSLKYLSMSRLKCKALPDAISDVWSLQALHITDSLYLLRLPKSIGKLKKLRTLNLSGCRYLNRLPDSIGDCHMLSNIDLWHCENLTVLPNSIGRNKKLRVLRLGCTGLRRLPNITKLENLQCLDLRRCRYLVQLPEGIENLKKLEVLNLEGCLVLRSLLAFKGNRFDRVKNLNISVGRGENSAWISEVSNIILGSGDADPSILNTYVMEDDAHKACLKNNTNLQGLTLDWMAHGIDKVDNESVQGVLDDLEPPPGIKTLGIRGYPGSQYTRWMQNQVYDRVQGPTPFPFLRVMMLYYFPDLKNLHGLVQLPCLEELYLLNMAYLDSISGGPFPSLVKLQMDDLPCLEELWMVAEGTMPDGEEGGGYCSFTPQLGQVILVGNCLAELRIRNCPKLEVKPHLPLLLQHLQLWSSEQPLQSPGQCQGSLLQSPGQCQGSSSFPSFDKLKKLQLMNVTGLGSGHGWELLQQMTALKSLEIIAFSGVQTELPESLWSLTSLRFLKVHSWSNIHVLPELLGELGSLQELTIEYCPSLSSLPQSMGQLCSLRKLKIKYLPRLTCLPQSICRLTTSLEVLKISFCPGLTALPQGIKDLTALKRLWIKNCPGLKMRCGRGTGEDWHLISHIPHVLV